MGVNSFPKSERLSGRDAISRLFDSGEKGFAYPIRYIFSVAEAEDAPGVAVLVSVSKKYFKRAYKRNLLKRRMREAFRTRKQDLAERARQKGVRVEMALMYSTKDIVEFNEINDAVEKILARIGERM